VPFMQLAASNIPIMPVEEVKRGMHGIGKTVFQGDSIEEFDVEIIGTLNNFLPKKDIILARLVDERLKRSGVIAGMSGSPVYVGGRLIGAIAYGWTFSKEPITGITPIEQMLEIGASAAERPDSRAAGRSPGTGEPQLYNPFEPPASILSETGTDRLRPAAGSAPGISRLEIPLVFSGCHPEIINRYGEIFRGFGLVPLMGGGGEKGQKDTGSHPGAVFEAGSAVSAQLVRGDISLAATGTMTFRDGDRILAFGHPFLSQGAVDFPMTAAEIVTVLPNVMRSFKLSNTTDFMGRVTTDHTNGIMGVVGGEPRMIPIKIELDTGKSGAKGYNYEMVHSKMLSPLLGGLVLINTLTADGSLTSEQVIDLSGRVELGKAGTVMFEDMFAGPRAAVAANQQLQNALIYLYNNSYGPAELERVDLKLRIRPGNPKANVSQVYLDRSTVHPGDSIHLEVRLDPYTGPVFSERFTVAIPEEKEESDLFILVGSGDMVTRIEFQFSPNRFRYTNLEHLVRLINRSRKNNCLYVKVYRQDKGLILGDEMLPGLPPSVWSLLRSDKTPGSVLPLNDYTVAELVRPTGFIINGFKVIRIKVKPRI
ncbi:MAG: SpoIVB peptidase S55 domain-containing protein, partial [Gemmatimonadota bacterium]|nr:SpoIVB peptidase S55 domain-containing protein [Gemmatimonadota bacterium]